MKTYLLFPLAVLAAAIMIHAQAKPTQPPLKLADSGESRMEWVSPDVHGDHTITFRIAAAIATDVKLHFADKNTPMTKDEKGVWSATIGPVEPEIYTYSYVIDGASVYAAIDGAGLDNTQVEVPGNPPRYDELQNVPHGTINLHTYDSQVQGRQRHFRVYLPPQYYSEPTRRFPVMYLFNGFDDVQWTTIGKVNVVLDNLIAQNKAVPMIIVMPFNRIHGENLAQLAPYAAQAKTAEERAGLASSLETIAVFEKELPNEIMPIVEQDYRVISDREHRAIAGLSFGGGTALGVGMRHLDMFGSIGEFATGTFGGTANPASGYVGYGAFDPDKVAPGMYKKLTAPATKLKLLYLSCGEMDPRLPFQKKAYEEFKKQGVDNVVFESFPGGHEFKFFRRGMADFASQIFK
jgi:enterochelin esterase family protein